MTTNNTATASAGGGIGLFGLTFVVLLVLKLTGLANLSWLIVFLPLIVGFSLWLVFATVFILIAILASTR